jgi:hypothetical protein
MKKTGQLYFPAALSLGGKGPRYSLDKESGRAPETVWTQGRREKSCLCRETNPGGLARTSLVFLLEL